MNNKPNIVLVHGAWGDGSSWHKVITNLEKTGHNVFATQLPLTCLDDDVETTRRLAEAQKGPVILVGHSYGGAVITEAANKIPNVAGLVYTAAYAPDAGENLAEMPRHAEPMAMTAAMHADNYGRLWISKEKFAENFCQDVDKTEANIMAAVQKPISTQCFENRLNNAGWKKYPSWYQISQNDRMLSPALQRFMAERIKPQKTISLPTSHASMISYPTEISNLIVQASDHVQANA